MRAETDRILPIESWRAQLVKLRSEVQNVHSHYRLWRATIDAISVQAGDAPRVWPDHYSQMYAVTQSMAVRRIIRGDNTQVSLCRLLYDLEQNAKSITLTTLWPDEATRSVPPHILNEEKKLIAAEWMDATDDHLREQIPREDRGALMKTNEVLIGWADSALPHIYAEPQGPLPTYEDLGIAIARVTEVVRRYDRFLRSVDVDPSDVRLEAGWTRIFDRPLFPFPPIESPLSEQ